MHYELKNTNGQQVIVDGYGALAASSTAVVTQTEADSFRAQRGLHISQAHMPKGVEVSIVIMEEAQA